MLTEVRNNDLFSIAQPIWAKGLEKEMNITIGLRTKITVKENQKTVIKIAGASVYRFYVNGVFGGHGPAAAAHGYYRVDQWDISKLLQPGDNMVAIEIAGYNVDSFYILNQPSFVQAEIVIEGLIVVATGSVDIDFQLGIIKDRIQKVQRYSYQRPFSEVYRIGNTYGKWRKDLAEPFEESDFVITDIKNLLPRGVKYPDFSIHYPAYNLSEGRFEGGVKAEKYWKDRSIVQVPSIIGGFEEAELEVIPSLEIQELKTISTDRINSPYTEKTEVLLNKNSFHIYDLGTNLTGFVGLKVAADTNVKLYLTFDEVLTDNDVSYSRLSCVNIISCEMTKGEHGFESFEPYTLRYLKVMVLEGSCTISNIYLRDYANSDVTRAGFECSDKRINQVFEAGRETFRQNALDIFMDCPSRERAGWLCDSYFTSRVEADLSGKSLIEKNFLENYLLPERYPNIPEGMLPMCYPSDHYNGQFIPNWALWLVIELPEYLKRSGDRALVDAYKNKIMKLFDYFSAFRNEDGLLEKLESWVFVEWSKANDFVQDVNYPTNMLYAETLKAAGELYNLKELLDEAENVKKVIREQAFNGEFFVDNAVRSDGRLIIQDNKTEVCQYYAFFFNIATPKEYPELWDKLLNKFGPARNPQNVFPDVYISNAFIGNYLRLELLSRFGYASKILEESLEYFLYMAERTGTLWEHIGTQASCNHGFASHVVRSYYRDILGVNRIDKKNRTINLQFNDTGIEWCHGVIPVEDDILIFQWKKDEDRIYYYCKAPDGYSIDIKNCTGYVLVQSNEGQLSYKNEEDS